MSIASARVGSIDISASLRRIEFWRKATEGLGRFYIEVLNKNGQYDGVFLPQADVSISSGGIDLMKGYVDISTPEIIHDSSRALALLETAVIVGRDYGQDLQNKFYDKTYLPQPADDIIADILLNSGCEVGFTSTHSAMSLYYDCKRSYDSDALRDILEYINYDGYVGTDKKWHMFPIGSIDSGIILKSIANDKTNNILKIVSHDEADITDQKNYIVIFGPNINDHYTELNAADWISLSGPEYTLSDYASAVYPIPYAGVYAIKCTGPVDSPPGRIALTFPRYNHNVLDFSKTAEDALSIAVYQHIPGLNPCNRAYLVLTDSNDNVIMWTPSGPQPFGYSGNPFFNGDSVWDVINVKVGYAQVIWPGGNPLDSWFVFSGTLASWTWKIKQIAVWADPYDHGFGYVDKFIVDALKIPIPAIAVARDETAPVVRKMCIDRYDLGSQHELQAYANSQLALRKIPLERVHLWAKGDVGLIGGVNKWLPGYRTAVNIPALGINGDYRFMSIHHVLTRNADFGWNHVVELDLVPADIPVQTLRWSYGFRPEAALLRKLRDRLTAIEAQQVTNRSWYIDLP
jgi:hypothetical protein